MSHESVSRGLIDIVFAQVLIKLNAGRGRRFTLLVYNFDGIVWLLESNPAIDPLVLGFAILRMIVHHEGEVVLGQLHLLVVYLDDECVGLDVVDGKLYVVVKAVHAGTR